MQTGKGNTQQRRQQGRSNGNGSGQDPNAMRGMPGGRGGGKGGQSGAPPPNNMMQPQMMPGQPGYPPQGHPGQMPGMPYNPNPGMQPQPGQHTSQMQIPARTNSAPPNEAEQAARMQQPGFFPHKSTHHNPHGYMPPQQQQQFPQGQYPANYPPHFQQPPPGQYHQQMVRPGMQQGYMPNMGVPQHMYQQGMRHPGHPGPHGGPPPQGGMYIPPGAPGAGGAHASQAPGQGVPPAGQPPQAAPKKPKSSAIQIIDPETMAEVETGRPPAPAAEGAPGAPEAPAAAPVIMTTPSGTVVSPADDAVGTPASAPAKPPSAAIAITAPEEEKAPGAAAPEAAPEASAAGDEAKPSLVAGMVPPPRTMSAPPTTSDEKDPVEKPREDKAAEEAPEDKTSAAEEVAASPAAAPAEEEPAAAAPSAATEAEADKEEEEEAAEPVQQMVVRKNKKNKKEMLKKADARGLGGDMASAYKAGPTPEEEAKKAAEEAKQKAEEEAKKAAEAEAAAKSAAPPVETPPEEEEDDDWEMKEDLALSPEKKKEEKKSAEAFSLRPGGGSGFSSSEAGKAPTSGAEGKKSYDRDFLLSFQKHFLDKPDGLPDMEIIMGEQAANGPPVPNRGPSGGPGSRQGSGGGGQGQGGPNDWRTSRPPTGQNQGPPPAARDRSYGPGGGVGRPNGQFGPGGGDYQPRGGGGKGGGKGNRKGKDAPLILGPVEPLKVTENRWTPGVGNKKSSELERLIKGMLNKMTPEKFEKLTAQFLEQPITCKEDLITVINLVFDKALFEPDFGGMYADLCVRCAEGFPEFKDPDDPNAKPHTFKRVLLNKCQEEFEAERAAEEDVKDLPQEEAVVIMAKAKKRMLGNIRFIGELYKKRMLTEKIMHECLIKLLGDIENPEEDEVECLCKLMTTIGKNLDHVKARNHMDEYFTRMKELSNNKALASRLRFMLQDVIDLRKSQWVARRNEAKAKTIAEVHAEAAAEQRQNAARDRAVIQQGKQDNRRDGGRGRGGRDDRGGGGGQGGAALAGMTGRQLQQMQQKEREREKEDKAKNKEEEWSTAGGGKDRRDRKNREAGSSASDNITLGPGGNAGRGGSRSRGGDDGGSDEITLGPGGGSMGGGAGGWKPGSQGGSRKGSDDEDAGARQPSRDNSRERPDRVAAAAEKKGNTKLTADRLQTKVSGTLEEFFHMGDLREFEECIKELLPQCKSRTDLVSALTSNILEQSLDAPKKQSLAVDALVQMHKCQLLDEKELTTAFDQQLEFLEDLHIDIPQIGDVFAKYIARAVVEGIINLTYVMSAFNHLIGDGPINAQKMAMLVIKQTAKLSDEATATKLFKDSKIDLDLLLPEDARGKKSLAETLEGGDISFIDPLGKVEGWLAKALEDGESNENIMAWIQSNVSKQTLESKEESQTLARVVMRRIMHQLWPGVQDLGNKEMMKYLEGMLSKHKQIMMKYITGQPQNQLAALFEVQAFCHQKSFPTGLIKNTYYQLYNVDILEEDCFSLWREDVKDPTPGKAKALFQLNDFFTWLETADEEEDDED